MMTAILCRRGVRSTPPKKKIDRFDSKLHLMVNLKFWESEKCGILFIGITPRSTLKKRVVVPVRVLSIDRTV